MLYFQNHTIQSNSGLIVPYCSFDDSSFDELLEKSESMKIYAQNLQKLMIEIYKTMNNLNPSCIWEFHAEKVVKYDL